MSDPLAIVTGASSGIGRELALALAETGLNVVGVARRRDKLEELEKQCKHFIPFIPGRMRFLPKWRTRDRKQANSPGMGSNHRNRGCGKCNRASQSLEVIDSYRRKRPRVCHRADFFSPLPKSARSMR